MGNYPCVVVFDNRGLGGVGFAVGRIKKGVWNFFNRVIGVGVVREFEKGLTKGKIRVIMRLEKNFRGIK